MSTHTTDSELCTRCGLCIRVCPSSIYEMTDDGADVRPGFEDKCVVCGHCMAICPPRAITVEALGDQPSEDLPPTQILDAPLREIMVRRRSIRAYTNEPVSREMLQKLVEAAEMAPMGFPPSQIEVSVAPTREFVEPTFKAGIESMQQLQKMAGSGFGRLMLRMMTGPKERIVIEQYLLPLVGPMLKVHGETGLDVITWGAPAMLVFHGARLSTASDSDTAIAYTHSMLMAEALGLGSVVLGIARHAIQQSKELRQLYNIPSENDVLGILCVGHPELKFSRSIKRHLRKITWVGD